MSSLQSNTFHQKLDNPKKRRVLRFVRENLAEVIMTSQTWDKDEGVHQTLAWAPRQTFSTSTLLSLCLEIDGKQREALIVFWYSINISSKSNQIKQEDDINSNL